MSHTPTPWRTEFNPTQKGDPATWIMQAGAQMYEKVIADCPWGIDGDTDSGDGDSKRDCTAAEAQANAAFIVRACNAHAAIVAENEKLRAACEAALPLLRMAKVPGYAMSDPWGPPTGLIEQINTALAAGRGTR